MFEHKEGQLKKELFLRLLTAGQNKARAEDQPQKESSLRPKGQTQEKLLEYQKQQLKALLEAKRRAAPGSQEHFRLVGLYNELLDHMVDNGLEEPLENELLLDDGLLSDKYSEFEKRWNRAHPYTIEQFIKECSFICLADIFKVESHTAQARVIRQYKGELPSEIRIRFYVPWGLSKWYKNERAIVFLDNELISLGLPGRMPIIEREEEYAVSYVENPDFWPKETPIKQDSLDGERVFAVELRTLETIINRNQQRVGAYQKYELGRFYLNQFFNQFTKDSLDSLKKAEECFKEAIELDETIAEAHSGLAACYIATGIYNIAAPEESFAKALEPALRALEIDDRLAEARTSLAYAYMCYEWDWPKAEREYKQALEINPDYAPARQGYAHWLGAMQRFPEALREIDRALEIEPNSPLINVVRGFILYYKGDYKESWEQFEHTKRLNRHFDATYYGLALACEPLALDYIEKGNFEEAKRMFKEAKGAAHRAVKFSHGNPVKIAAQAHVHALSGEEEKAQQELRQLIALRTEEHISPFQIATIYAALVTTCAALERHTLALEYYNQALNYLEEAYKTHDQWLVLLNVEPRFDILREDERFKELIRQLKFPPDAKTDDALSDQQANYQKSSESTI